MLPEYADLLAPSDLPPGPEHSVYRRGDLDFVAYELPPLVARRPSL